MSKNLRMPCSKSLYNSLFKNRSVKQQWQINVKTTAKEAKYKSIKIFYYNIQKLTTGKPLHD